jgi:hypothetical protein
MAERDDFERRLLAEVQAGEIHFPKAMRTVPEERRRFGLRLPGILLRPAFAYALVLALLGPAYLGLAGLRSGPPAAGEPLAPATPAAAPAVPARAAGLGSVKTLELGGQVRDEGAGSRLVVGESDDFVLLSFLAPTRRGRVYRAVLSDAGSRTVAEKAPLSSSDGRGSFTLVCEARLLAEGDYVLSVSEVASGPAAGEGAYQFRFRVVRSAP